MLSKHRRQAVIVTMALVAFAAVNVASASASTQHWYVGGTRLSEGTPTKITVSLTPPYKPPFTPFEYKEKSHSFEGWGTALCTRAPGISMTVENPVGGAAGTATGGFGLTGCSGLCTSMTFNGLIGGATEFESNPALKLAFNVGRSAPQNSCVFVNWLAGSFMGVSEAATSSLSFTEASTSELTHNGPLGEEVARLHGHLLLEGTEGKSVYLAP